MRDITYLLRLFLFESKLKLARAMEFRADFVFSLITSFILSFMAPLFQFFIYSKTNGYPGWTFDQIMIFQAIMLLYSGITETLLGNVKYIMESIVQYGLLDRYLLLPYSSIGFILTKGFNFRNLGIIIAGISSLIFAIFHFGLILNWMQIILFSLFIILGIILMMALNIFFCSIALRIVYVARLKEILERIYFFAGFPAEIYSGFIRFIYLTILPLGIWVYYPAQTLLGRLNVFSIYGSISTIILFIVSIKVWNHQIKKYTSSGG
jgi:ABC-2 type transport system permease protein